MEKSMHFSKTVSGWRQARRPAKEKYRPLREKLPPVKTVLAGSNLQQGEVQGDALVEVLFDSFSQWRFEGLRSAGKRMRQLLYRAGCYQVDIQIEAPQETNRLLVTGLSRHDWTRRSGVDLERRKDRPPGNE
jgi:hypothetical protein